MTALSCRRTLSGNADREVTLTVRLVLVLAALETWIYRDQIDEFIAALWEALLYHKSCWWFRHDSWEPCLAVATFAVTIGAWFHLEMSVSPRWLTVRHYLDKHRIATDGSDLAAWDDDKRVSNETMWYIGPLLLIDFAFPRRYALLDDHPSAPTLAGLIGGVALSLLLFDLFFFCGHWCVHRLLAPAPATWLHGRHHSANNIRAGDAIRHSFLDGSFDVVCSVLALKVARTHPLTRSVYNLVAIYLITEAHCGFDCPWMLHHVVPMQAVAGPRRHDLHHRRGSVNFQKFFTYLDAACGTSVQ